MPYRMLIDGELVDGASSFDVINPATEQPVAQCPKADAALVDRAVNAAKRAFPGWSAKTAESRGECLSAIAGALESRASEFASLLTSEQGKPLSDAMREILGCVFMLRSFAKMRVEPHILRSNNGHVVTEYRRPLGVVAAITPWNVPMIIAIVKLGQALVTGNTVVLKPAPTTPCTSLLFGELCRELLPPGVLNIICDQNDLGDMLTAHPDVAKISFTGSTRTGKKVMASAAGGVKSINLELGGNDVAIVLDDVDPWSAARKVYAGAMANAGQICTAIKRAYVPSQMYDAFCDELTKLAKQAVVGDGSEPGTTMGPLQNRMQFEKVQALIEDARNRGAILSGGDPIDRPGYFIPPTIVRDIDDDAPLVRQEQFGPVLPVLRYDDVDTVVTRANDTEYGLAGTIWARDVQRATEIARRIDTGTLFINQWNAFDPTIPARGAKQSGFGAQLGEAGLHEYTQATVVNAVPFKDA